MPNLKLDIGARRPRFLLFISVPIVPSSGTFSRISSPCCASWTLILPVMFVQSLPFLHHRDPLSLPYHVVAVFTIPTLPIILCESFLLASIVLLRWRSITEQPSSSNLSKQHANVSLFDSCHIELPGGRQKNKWS
jgi:hypothetical protein